MGQDTTVSPAPVVAGSALGIPIVACIRRLLVVALVSAFVYAAVLTSSKGYCAGGFDGTGGFVDAAGRPVDTAPSCLQLTLGPSPVVFAAFVVIVLVALSRVISRAVDVEHALRILDRSAAAIAIIAVVSGIVSAAWFWAIPVETWGGPSGYSVVAPFPFGVIDVEVTPMRSPAP